MASPERRVGQLLLKAGSEDEVRRVTPRLEDALRCASLPDGGGRVLLVRRLALGRLASEMSAQALSRLIERRMARLEPDWAEGGSPAAAAAGQVLFDSALQARTRLALRLAAGQPCDEWYWPLAVPEFRAANGRTDALRRIAWALAGWPEARQALPSWAAALCEAGAARPLAAAIGEDEGEALLRRAGIARAAPAPVRGWGDAGSRSAPGSAGGAGADSAAPDRPPAAGAARSPARAGTPHAQTPDAPLPAWLRQLWPGAGLHQASAIRLRAAAADAAPAEGIARGPHAEHLSADAARGPLNAGADLDPDPDPMQGAMRRRPVAPGARAHGNAAGLPSSASPVAPIAQPASSERPDSAQQASPTGQPAAPEPPLRVAARHPYPDGAPSAFAGLLFLLPLLRRLGLAHWPQPDGDEDFVRRVLAAALRRLRAPDDDPAWSLAAPWLPDLPALSDPAPPGWSDPLLAAPRGGPAPAAALAACGSLEQQAGLWLDLARRWLRRAGGIGLASLVCRPGRIALSATHADLRFRLADTDLRVRRLGLDIDPGWLPWYGRVVGFHFDEAPWR